MNNTRLPKWWCRNCEGTGLVDSEDGGNTENCSKCEGSGIFKPHEN